MILQSEMVEAFHEKLGLVSTAKWKTLDKDLRFMGETCLEMAFSLETRVANGDVHALRYHLILEELGEMMIAKSEETAFDGGIDLLYVLLGTFLTYDWPAEEGFAEVHIANMQKEKNPDDALKNRIRDKGEKWTPPSMQEVLDRYHSSSKTMRQTGARREIKIITDALNRFINKETT